MIPRAMTHSAADAIAPSMRGSTPRPTASATPPDPARPPKLQPACSDDMIGLPSVRSTATPWAFIATSIEPFAAPNTTSASPSSTGDGAFSTSETSGR